MGANHIMHPYEDPSLRFSEVAELIVSVATGKIHCREKFDGIRLGVIVTDREVRFFRSAGDKNAGGLMPDQFVGRFSAPHVDAVIESAARAVFRAVQTGLVCVEDDSFSIEVISSEASNVISYVAKAIVFHTDALFLMEPCVLDGWILRGPASVNMTSDVHPDAYRQQVAGVVRALATLPAQSGMSNVDPTIAEYVCQRLCAYLEANGFGGRAVRDLALRIVNHGDVPSLTTIKKSYPRSIHGALGDIVKRPSTAIRWAREPLERIVRSAGDIVLQGRTSTLVEDAQAERVRLWGVLGELRRKANADPNNRARAITQLDAVEQVNAIEGVVFTWREKTYKLTGSFAPFNAAHGIWRHNR